MLRLTGNNVSIVQHTAINNAPNLRYLYLARNRMRTLLPGAFSVFRQLEILDLSHNELAEISTDTFAGMERLMQLNLDGNHIQDIAPGAFQNTPLLLLLLAHNCLSSVNPQMFQVCIWRNDAVLTRYVYCRACRSCVN